MEPDFSQNIVEIYTDGSCHRGMKIGTWAAIILYEGKKIQLSGIESVNSHNRMELLAVINSLIYTEKNFGYSVLISLYTDSQYVANIPRRAENLLKSGFCNSKGKILPNHDLLCLLVDKINILKLSLLKVKAHQKAGSEPDFNRQVDILARKLLRMELKKYQK